MAEWVIAVASLLGLASIFILWRQLRIFVNQLGILTSQIAQAQLQLEADHERSRRERALELMQFWCCQRNSASPFYVCGRKLVEELTKQQCESLASLEPFQIDPKHRHLLTSFRADFGHRLPKSKRSDSPVQDALPEEIENLELSKPEMASLRMIAVNYLNHLETIATAWRHNIADRGILEEEFQKIISPKTNEFVLETYRRVTGVYPSIQELTSTLQEKLNRRTSKAAIR